MSERVAASKAPRPPPVIKESAPAGAGAFLLPQFLRAGAMIEAMRPFGRRSRLLP
jgi:hypothetical protein